MMSAGIEDKNVCIGIGAPRSGTTWLSKCLAEHPDVCFSKPKETFFFLRDYEFQKGIDEYVKFFTDLDSCNTIAEFSPFYFTDPQVSDRIYSLLPTAKLVAVLRHPVDRLFSQYEYRKERGRTAAGESFEMFLKNNPELLEHSRYAKKLKPFLDTFGRDKIHVIIYEKFTAAPVNEIQGLYGFLGIDDTFIPPSIEKRINASGLVMLRSKHLKRLIDKRKSLKRGVFGRSVISVLKFLGIGRLVTWLDRINVVHKKQGEENGSRETLSDNVRKQVLQDLYQEDVEQLSALFGVDVDIWK